MREKCRYKLLHKNEIGKISLCKSCGNLRVEIGHLMSLISVEPFQLILEDFKHRYEFYQQCDAQELLEPIFICLNKRNLFLKLSIEEFKEVLELFEVSNHMLEVDSLIFSH